VALNGNTQWRSTAITGGAQGVKYSSAAPPSLLPGFRGLAEEIADELGRSDLIPSDPDEPVQFDLVMGELNELQHDVHARVSSRLRSTVKPNSYHSDLLQLISGQGHLPRIVTTNFDLLFEIAAARLGITLPVSIAPALPLGNQFDGLVHLHGPVDPSPSQRMVVTDTDFGQAYITDGWATQFLTRMFEKYTVVFVGYSADDTVMRYLARALPTEGSTRFAFMEEEQAATMKAKWERLSITPIPYPSPAAARHVSLQSFITHWRERDTATPQQRFDLVQAIVQRGPNDLAGERELRWLLGEWEYAQHFMNAADPAVWMQRLDELEIIDELFNPEAVATEVLEARAQWAARALHTDDGAAFLSVVSRHDGHLSWSMWSRVWLHLYQDYKPVNEHRQLLLLLAADQSSRDNERLSGLLRPVAEKDVQAAEVLLNHLLRPRLKFQPRRSWLGGRDSLDTDLALGWKNSAIRDAWPTLLAHLSDPDHLVSVVLNLIREVEATESLFGGNERRYALSLRRPQVDGIERFGRDDPYVLVVDIARDLLREFVRSEGTQRAIRYLDSSSEMIQRLALDSLVEARSGEADILLRLLIERDLVFGIATKPEVYRLLRSGYRHASLEVKVELIAHIRGSVPPEREAEVRDYERYNGLVWMSDGVPADDPIVSALAEEQAQHKDFGPRERPDLNSWIIEEFEAKPEPTAEGRFRGMPVGQVVAVVAADPTLNDVYDGRKVLSELGAYLEELPGQEISLMDELVAQSLWSASVWSLVFGSAIRLGSPWSAEPLLRRLDQVPGNLADISRGLVFAITYPGTNSQKSLENATERCRLLFGLWRRVIADASSEPPTDPSAAHGTARGSLAYAYVETVLRTTQERGDVQVDAEGLAGFTELIAAQASNVADPSPMMLARYAGHILALASDWFDSYLGPSVSRIDGSPQNVSLWAGVLSGNFISKALRLRTRDAMRVAWPQVSAALPGLVEAFIDQHAAQFVWDTPPDQYAWADPFIAMAPVVTRVRWIRSVARRLDGEKPTFQDLLFAHWQHRLDGQPPLHGSEQRALLEWLTLPGLNVDRAADLFTAGPIGAPADEDHGFDYYDFEEAPAKNNSAFLRIGLHLLRGRRSLPSFLQLLVSGASKGHDDDRELASQVWGELLRLGYWPAREHLNVEATEE
jgi:hypothetical protein